MTFDNVPAQRKAKALVEAWLRNERVPHSVLIKGPPGTCKRILAMEFAKALNCLQDGVLSCNVCVSCRKIDNLMHPDVRVLMPLAAGSKRRTEGEMWDLMRSDVLAYIQNNTNLALSNANLAREHLSSLQREIYFAPTEGRKKVGIIFEADCMHPAGANALLKTLEEPPSRAHLVLVSTFSERLLPTIRSRCQTVKTQALNRNEHEVHLRPMKLAPDRFDLTVRLADGNLQRATEVSSGDFDETRRRVERFFQAAVKQKDEEYWKLVAELGGKTERLELERFLETCGQYLRDLFLVRNGRRSHARHLDRMDFLRRLESRITAEELQTAIDELDEAFLSVTLNVAPSLALVDLWRCLSHQTTQTASA